MKQTVKQILLETQIKTAASAEDVRELRYDMPDDPLINALLTRLERALTSRR